MNLKEYRKKQNLTQIDVAKKVGVSLLAYQLWERGVSNPNPQNLKKLRKALLLKDNEHLILKKEKKVDEKK